MEHPHAHNSPASTFPSRNPPRHSTPGQLPFGLIPNPTAVQHIRPETAHTSQQRRLQLRNTGFRATHLTTNTLNRKLSKLFGRNEEPPTTPARGTRALDTQESTAPVTRIRCTRSFNSSVGTLQDYSNSTRYAVNRRTPVPIFEDNPERPLLDGSPVAAIPDHHDAWSSPLLPIQCPPNYDTMHLSEISADAWNSPPSVTYDSSESPGSGSRKVMRRARPGVRKAVPPPPSYTAHIEELLHNARTQAHSPHSGLPFKAKFEAARSENEKLKQVMHEIELVFDEKVKEAVEHMASTEGELRRRIVRLEDVLEEKEHRIQVLEYQHSEAIMDLSVVEAQKAAIEKLEVEKESLVESNRNMAQRNEVLTALLAMSPTKSQSGSELASPTRDGVKKNPRPRSMFACRTPSSPSAKYAVRSHSVLTSPVLSGSYFGPATFLADELRLLNLGNDSGDLTRHIDDSESIDSGLGESCSVHSRMTHNSRRSTLASQGSNSPSSWGFPLPMSPSRDDGTVKPAFKRKPRRFMAGSTQLKPLLLPTMSSDVVSSPDSALVPLPLFPDRRYVSEESIDPTTAFLSEASEEASDRTTMSREDPLAWLKDTRPPDWESSSIPVDPGRAQRLSQRQLDNEIQPGGNPTSPQSVADTTESADDEVVTVVLHVSPRCRHGANGRTKNVPDLEAQFSPRLQQLTNNGTQTSYVEAPVPPKLHEAATEGKEPLDIRAQFSPRLHQATNGGTKTSDFRAQPLPKLQETTNNGKEILDVKAHTPPKLPQTPNDRTGTSDLEAQCLPKLHQAKRSPSPLEILQRRTLDPRPLATVSVQAVYGTLARYTMYIREARRDPMSLARRVIANAWYSHWRMLGRLSWWVLGLFLGHRASSDDTSRATHCTTDWSEYDAQAIASKVQDEFQHERRGKMHESVSDGPSTERPISEGAEQSFNGKGSRLPPEPASKEYTEKKAGWGKSLYLWGKFSFAIMLAVGGAVVKGPGEMLKDRNEYSRT